MAKRPARSRLRTVLLVGSVVAVVAVGGGWLALHQAKVLVGQAVTTALGPGRLEYGGLRLDRTGRILVDDLAFHPEGRETVRATRAQVATPGWRWFLRNVLDPQLQQARLERLRLSLSGVRVDHDALLPLKELEVFGVATASPWAAEGCLQGVNWTAATLADAGLAAGRTSLQFDYRAQAGDLVATTIVETFGVSRLRWVRVGTLPNGEANMLSLRADPGLIRNESWEVRDQGFVAARNRYCAEKDEVDARQFVDRHLDSVARRLATLGLEVDDETRDRYRRFALAGGKVGFSVAYPRPTSAATLIQQRASAVWADLPSTFDRNGDVVTLDWRRIQAMPPLASDVSTYAALLQERVDALRIDSAEAIASEAEPVSIDDSVDASSPAATPDEALVATPSESATTDSAIATASETTTTDAAVAAADAAAPDQAGPMAERPSDRASTETAVASTPAATQSASVEAAPVAVPESPPAAPRVARTLSPTPRGPLPRIPELTRFVRPTPESQGRVETLATARLEAARRGPPAPRTLSWNELSAVRGQTIEIWTMHSPPRPVQVLEVSDDSLRVSYRIKNNGEATFNIRREAFLRAVLDS